MVLDPCTTPTHNNDGKAIYISEPCLYHSLLSKKVKEAYKTSLKLLQLDEDSSFTPAPNNDRKAVYISEAWFVSLSILKESKQSLQNQPKISFISRSVGNCSCRFFRKSYASIKIWYITFYYQNPLHLVNAGKQLS